MASEDGEKIALPMAGRSVAKRSDPVTVSTPRGPVEVVRQQWRSQRPGSKWDWEWLARLRVCVTGDRAQPRARRSDRRRCCRRESSLRGCSTQLRAQRRNWSEEGRKGPPRRRLTRIRLELGAPSAVPPAFACRGRGRGKRGRPAARAARGERRGGSCRPAAACGTRAWLVRPALARSGRPQQAGWGRSRRPRCGVFSLGCSWRDGESATGSNGRVGGPRLCGDRPDWHRLRDRDEDEELRAPPSHAVARAGRVVVTSLAKVGPARHAARFVRRSSSRDTAPGGRRARRVDRSACVDPPKCSS